MLLTGATGRLGRCIAAELAHAGCDLVVLVRAPSPQAARERMGLVLSLEDGLDRATVVCGDVNRPWLGLGARDRRRLRASVDVIVHAAATTSFSLPLEEARATNLAGTANVLAFAERASRLQVLAHVSTAFVAGRRTGRIFETELEHERGFLNSYQQSKHEAELLVSARRDCVPAVVFRPTVVLDGAGSIQRRSAFRFAYELVRRGVMPALPGSAATPVDLVTEHDAAWAIARLLERPGIDGTYHVAGGHRAPSLGDIVGEFDPRYLGEEQFAWELTKWRHERPALARMFDELECFIYELAYPKTFDTTRCEAALGGPVRREDPVAALVGEETSERVEAGSQ